jgi:hypothetical protein
MKIPSLMSVNHSTVPDVPSNERRKHQRRATAEADFAPSRRAPTLAGPDSGTTAPGFSAGVPTVEGPWPTSSGVPALGRSPAKKEATRRPSSSPTLGSTAFETPSSRNSDCSLRFTRNSHATRRAAPAAAVRQQSHNAGIRRDSHLDVLL